MKFIKDMFIFIHASMGIVSLVLGVLLCSYLGSFLVGIGMGLTAYSIGYIPLWASVIAIASIPLTWVLGILLTATGVLLTTLATK